MSAGNLLDYVKVLVRNKLNLRFGMSREEGQVLPNFDTMLDDLPVYIRKAIIELQQVKLIPPAELSFVSIDRKREALKPDGDLRYNYYSVPSDFASVEDFVVEGYLKQPQWSDSEFSIRSRSLIEAKPYFTIVQAENEAGEKEHRLIMEPFPEDDRNVYLTYWIDGTNVNSTTLKERYWDAIVTVVMRELDLMDSYTANDHISSRVTQERHPQGNTSASGARPKTRLGYFTKTSKTLRPPRL